MVLIESLRESFDRVKNFNNILYTLIAGFGYILIGTLNIIPILGALITSYLIPRLTAWYYNKVGLNVNPNYDVAFKALLIPHLIIHLGLVVIIVSLGLALFSKLSELILLGSVDSFSELLGLFSGIIIGAILILAGAIVFILFLYTIYGGIVGKVNQLKIEFSKSLYLLALYIICLLYTSPSPRDGLLSRMPSSA